jgi:hypothetical protein
LLGAVLGFRDNACGHVSWDLKVCEQQTCKVLREHLDERTMQALLSEGRRMSLREGARSALNESPQSSHIRAR